MLEPSRVTLNSKRLVIPRPGGDVRVDLLLTGFGTFGELEENPTEAAIKALSPGPGVATHVFRTALASVEADLPRLIQELRPRRVVAFGLAASAGAVRLETTARNRSSETPDVDGARLPSPIAVDGPDRLVSTLPLGEIGRALAAREIATTSSDDAGGYLCNYAFYRLQQLAPASGIEASGFVHAPGQGAYRAAQGRPVDYLALIEVVAATLL